MIEIRIDGQLLYIAKSTTLQLEIQNNVFSINRIEGDIVFTFDVPALENDIIFKQARFVYVQRCKKYACQFSVAGIEIAAGDLYIQKSSVTTYSCGLVINPFPIDFAEKKLSENDYGEDIIISRYSETLKAGWLQFLYNSLREKSIYKFPLFLDTAFYGSSNNDFGWFLLPSDPPANNQSGYQASLNTNDRVGLDRCYLNRLFTNAYGNVIETWANTNRGIRVFNNTTVSNPNSFAFAPAIHLLWILQKVIQNAGYQMTGNFQADENIQKIYSQSLRALDGLASDFNNTVAKTTAVISQPVSFSNTPEDDLILPFEVDNQQHFYFRAPSTGLHQISVSITTYLPANLLTSGTRPDDSSIPYKEAIIFFVIEEYDNFPEYLYGAFHENWNNGVGFISNGIYTPFGYYYKAYTLDLLQSEIGYTGAGFYTFNFNFSQTLIANRDYKFFFGKVRGSTALYLTMLDNYENISVVQDISSLYKICNVFANKLKFAEHVPALSNSDFISNICNSFGLSMFIDSAKGQVEFSFFKDILAQAQTIDLSQYLLNKKSYIEKNDNKKYRYMLKPISNDDNDIDETKLLSPVRSYSQLPHPVIHYDKICFVENENRYYIAQRVGNSAQNWVFKWNPYAGNDQVLEIGEGNSEDIAPQFKVPHMKIAEEKAEDYSHFLLNIEVLGCSPIFNTGNKDFEMVLINYLGRKKLKQGNIYYEHAAPVCMDRDGNAEPGINLTATGGNSIGETCAAPWLSFLASHERICHTFLLPVSMFMEVLQLLKPQDTPISRQTRFVLIDSVKLLPIKMTFQFTEGSRYIIADIAFAKEKVEL